MRNKFVWIGSLTVVLVVMMCVGSARDAAAAIPPTWCTHAGTQKLTGDVNNDAYDDYVCHDRNSGYKWVALGSASGHNEVWSSPSGWCVAPAVLYLGDVNGDGRDDLVCRDPGRLWIDYTTSTFFNGTDWMLNTTWCTHSGTTLFVADQNADGRVDLTCRDNTGFTWVDYADTAGRYFDTDVGRPAIDLQVTDIIRGGSTYQVNLRNHGAAGVVTRVDCSVGPYEVYKSVSISMALGATASTFITTLPFVNGATVRCTATGRGNDGLPELFLSNNAMSRYF